MNTPSKEDLNNLFGPMFEEYFGKKYSETPINSTAQPTQIHKDSPSTSSISVEEHEAPPIETTSDEQTFPISLKKVGRRIDFEDLFAPVARLEADSGFELIAYSDADHPGCKDDCKSTSGGLQFLVIRMRTQLLDYGYKYNRIPMYCDSKSAIAISCNPVQHLKTKHIDIRYHFIKEHVEK
nr:hypothetical protein [Tanacetum cinerariifolium]